MVTEPSGESAVSRNPQSDRRPTSSFTIDSVLQRNLPAYGAEPNRVALVYGDQELTFEQLQRNSESLAAGLLANGFQRGDAVSVIAHNCIEWFELLFALAKIGGIIVPINYLLKPKEISYIVSDAGSRWIVGDDALWDSVTEVCTELGGDLTTIALSPDSPGDLSYEVLRATTAPLQEFIVEHDELLLLQYTSGTTGFPKGAMHTHETILWNSIHQIPDFEITRKDVHLVIPAMCWAAGFHSFTLAVFWAGGRIVINPSRGFDPEAFCETVEKHGITKTILVPSVLRRILSYPEIEKHDLSSLNLALSGGEPVPVQLIEEWSTRVPSCALVQGYGMGEFPTLMLSLGAEDAVRKVGSAGRSCLVGQVRVVDNDFQDVSGDEVGEIIVRSPACMVGYRDKPEATAETFQNGWMRTGDLARVDAEGYVYVAGRVKEMLIVGGLNVYPAEVERVLLDLDAVMEAAVVGVPDSKWGEVAAAFICLKPNQSLTVEELEQHSRVELANYKVPKHWRIDTTPLPRTTSGKIQRHALSIVAGEEFQLA